MEELVSNGMEAAVQTMEQPDYSGSVKIAAKKKLLFIVNVDWFFVSHRLPIALAALEAGYEVHLGAALTGMDCSLKQLGVIVHDLPISRSGTNPFAELITLKAICSLVREVQPDIVHLVTSKAMLYGGLAARICRTPAVVVSVPGLGYLFMAQGLKAFMIRSVVLFLYRLALGMDNLRVIFQNANDREILVRRGGVTPEKSIMIRGSGVDLAKYAATPEPDGLPVVAMASRLLLDKGVREFVAAARLLKERGIKARFLLIGETDPDNPASVPAEVLDAWRSEQIVELLGFRPDIAEIFAASHLVVLPSYGEGLPKVLLEAAACSRAVVTTDLPGCSDAVIPGKTGLLVPAKNSEALADAIEKLIEDSCLRQSMGREGRHLAEKTFDVLAVVHKHLAIYTDLIQPAGDYAAVPALHIENGAKA